MEVTVTHCHSILIILKFDGVSPVRSKRFQLLSEHNVLLLVLVLLATLLRSNLFIYFNHYND